MSAGAVGKAVLRVTALTGVDRVVPSRGREGKLLQATVSDHVVGVIFVLPWLLCASP
jgi:hypothetical protein